MTTLDLDELERLLAKTTGGDWTCWLDVDQGAFLADVPDADKGRLFAFAESVDMAAAMAHMKFCMAAINNAAALIARCREAEAGGWISVKDRLPDAGELVEWYAPGNNDFSFSHGRMHGDPGREYVAEVSKDEDEEYPIDLYSHWRPTSPPDA